MMNTEEKNRLRKEGRAKALAWKIKQEELLSSTTCRSSNNSGGAGSSKKKNKKKSSSSTAATRTATQKQRIKEKGRAKVLAYKQNALRSKIHQWDIVADQEEEEEELETKVKTNRYSNAYSYYFDGDDETSETEQQVSGSSRRESPTGSVTATTSNAADTAARISRPMTAFSGGGSSDGRSISQQHFPTIVQCFLVALLAQAAMYAKQMVAYSSSSSSSSSSPPPPTSWASVSCSYVFVTAMAPVLLVTGFGWYLQQVPPVSSDDSSSGMVRLDRTCYDDEGRTCSPPHSSSSVLAATTSTSSSNKNGRDDKSVKARDSSPAWNASVAGESAMTAAEKRRLRKQGRVRVAAWKATQQQQQQQIVNNHKKVKKMTSPGKRQLREQGRAKVEAWKKARDTTLSV